MVKIDFWVLWEWVTYAIKIKKQLKKQAQMFRMREVLIITTVTLTTFQFIGFTSITDILNSHLTFAPAAVFEGKASLNMSSDAKGSDWNPPSDLKGSPEKSKAAK